MLTGYTYIPILTRHQKGSICATGIYALIKATSVHFPCGSTRCDFWLFLARLNFTQNDFHRCYSWRARRGNERIPNSAQPPSRDCIHQESNIATFPDTAGTFGTNAASGCNSSPRTRRGQAGTSTFLRILPHANFHVTPQSQYCRLVITPKTGIHV